jgi:hypothetical protein
MNPTLRETRIANFGPYENVCCFFQRFNDNTGKMSSFSPRTMIPLQSTLKFINWSLDLQLDKKIIRFSKFNNLFELFLGLFFICL